jgi:3D (Asp-Asp-Asp) domain-containing protein
MIDNHKLSLARARFNGIDPRDLRMSNLIKFTIGALLACFLVSCAEQAPVKPSATSASLGSSTAGSHPRHTVRTTAYTHSERGGHHNAIGSRLSSNRIRSAASDWSVYPLGTKFRIVGTNENYVIDDYGTALVGTNTIDLYKPSRLEMRRWGVRHVDIDILQWGSAQESLRVLTPRAKHRQVQKMIVSLRRKSFVQRSAGTLY